MSFGAQLAPELPFEVARLIDDFHRGLAPHEVKMASYLVEISRMERLEELWGHGRLPSRVVQQGRRVFDLFDDAVVCFLGLLKRSGFKVHCRPGCVYCCYNMPAGVSSLELILLYLAVCGNGLLERCFRRSLRANERLAQIRQDRSFWPEEDAVCRGREGVLKAYLQTSTACPFLNEGRCLVYPVRPLACRMHFSLTPHHWCDPRHFQNGHAVPFNVEPGDEVLDALERIDARLDLGLSDVLTSGFLCLTVNVMRFRKVELTA